MENCRIFVNEYVRKFKKIRGVGKHFILYNEVEYERILTYMCLIRYQETYKSLCE